MAETVIVKCSCAHTYQDTKYGKGKRVGNSKPAGGSNCTVCGVTHRGITGTIKTRGR